MQSNTVYDCTIVHLDKHHHAKGNITVVENGITVPFDVRRAYYLYDVPGGESRGGNRAAANRRAGTFGSVRHAAGQVVDSSRKLKESEG